MKKIFYLAFAAMVMSAFVGVTSCGPSAAEKARMDSIRIADSLRVVDSIKIADSLKAEREAEAQREAYRQKVDETAASIKAPFVLKNYELSKVVSANEGMMGSKKSITIYDVVKDKKDNMSLKDSQDLGCIVDLTQGNNSRQVVVKIHCGGSGPFYQLYYIDIESMELLKVTDE